MLCSPTTRALGCIIRSFFGTAPSSIPETADSPLVGGNTSQTLLHLEGQVPNNTWPEHFETKGAALCPSRNPIPRRRSSTAALKSDGKAKHSIRHRRIIARLLCGMDNTEGFTKRVGKTNYRLTFDEGSVNYLFHLDGGAGTSHTDTIPKQNPL